MDDKFIQYLIIFLICLLFAKDFIPALLEKFFGIKIKNGNGLAELFKHHAEDDLRVQGEIKSDLNEVKENVSNHIPTAIKQISDNMLVLSTDMKWLKDLRKNGSNKSKKRRRRND